MLNEEVLIELGRKYCEARPGSQLVSVDVESRKIVTCYCGSYITSNADKVAQKFGIDLSEQGVA